MAEYIEREALLSKIKALPEQERIETMKIYDCIRSIPAADVAEVKHSFWKAVNCGPDWCEAECSRCGDKYEFTPYRDFFKYCPNCGEKMDLGDDEV